jgi:hypothetical protein
MPWEITNIKFELKKMKDKEVVFAQVTFDGLIWVKFRIIKRKGSQHTPTEEILASPSNWTNEGYTYLAKILDPNFLKSLNYRVLSRWEEYKRSEYIDPIS